MWKYRNCWISLSKSKNKLLKYFFILLKIINFFLVLQILVILVHIYLIVKLGLDLLMNIKLLIKERKIELS